MIRKKSNFLTFCFAFLPGAGQMYMGFMKRGISIMSSFFLLIFLSSWLNLGPLMFIMPVIWFYAFFDTFNLRAMPDDEFYATEDDYLILSGFEVDKFRFFQGKYRTVIAVSLIVIGFTILWNNLFDLCEWILPNIVREAVYRFGHYFPQLLIGLGIIALGVYLIIGKKRDLDSNEQMRELEDKGGFIK